MPFKPLYLNSLSKVDILRILARPHDNGEVEDVVERAEFPLVLLKKASTLSGLPEHVRNCSKPCVMPPVSYLLFPFTSQSPNIPQRLQKLSSEGWYY